MASFTIVGVLVLLGWYAYMSVSGQSPHVTVPSATAISRTGEGTLAVTVTQTQQTIATTVVQGTLVSFDGTFRLGRIYSGSDIPAEPVVYLEVDGRNYRLLGVDFFSFADGTRVRVTGTLVVPSSWSRPSPFFVGDIYAEAITAV